MTKPMVLDTNPEVEKVYSWRMQWLHAAGYNVLNQDKIATDLSIDLHFACDLRKKCSDEQLCMRIIFGND